MKVGHHILWKMIMLNINQIEETTEKKTLKKKYCLQKKNKSYECDTFFQTIFNSHVEIEKNPGSLGVVLREKNLPLGFFDGKYVLYMKP